MKITWEAADIQRGMIANEGGSPAFTHMVIAHQEHDQFALVNYVHGLVLTEWHSRESLAKYMTSKNYFPIWRK